MTESSLSVRPHAVVVAAVRGVRAQVCDALRAAGWTATETQDARSALNAAVHTKPDAVVADLDMPGLDLSALLSGISASAEAGGVPIVGLSSTRGALRTRFGRALRTSRASRWTPRRSPCASSRPHSGSGI
jgi:DNA-binding response OmpR family regulator